MSPRAANLMLARQMRSYREGDKVKVIRGNLAGKILTVHQSSNDWVTFKEAKTREVMSKRNVEPEAGFTAEEMNQAERVARKGG